MKVVIEVDGKEVTIPLEKAREVYNQLKELFGEKEVVPYVPNVVPYYIPDYTTTPVPSPYSPPWIITC